MMKIGMNAMDFLALASDRDIPVSKTLQICSNSSQAMRAPTVQRIYGALRGD